MLKYFEIKKGSLPLFANIINSYECSNQCNAKPKPFEKLLKLNFNYYKEARFCLV